jgi:outer membrane protein
MAQRPIRLRTYALAATALVALIGAPASLASDVLDIGYLDQTAFAGLKQFNDANRQLAQYKAQLDRDFPNRMRAARSAADQQRIVTEFQGKLADRQRQLVGPLLAKAQVAVASVASSKNLSVVVDKRIIIFGGQDITKNVIALLSGVGDPVPPVSTPPPSAVGFVDQQQIDDVPKLKTVNDQFIKFQNDENQQVQSRLKSAKTDADRAQIFKDAQKAVQDKQHTLVDPVVDETRNVIADVAKKRGLVLVIDKGNLIYGGTDVTADVRDALK